MIISCEHAGNEIPEEYLHLFKGREDALYTHKAIDFGALDLARAVSDTLKVPLFYTSISRLLVESNRSEDHAELFSPFTKGLLREEKARIIENYYSPHRQQVEEAIATTRKEEKKAYHVSFHTFTPVMDGEVRVGDIGILFDPSRPLEVDFFEKMKNILAKVDSTLIVEENFPYPGTDDGFPTFLRKKFSQEDYCGIELEVNQKYFLNGDMEIWETLKASICAAFLIFSHSI